MNGLKQLYSATDVEFVLLLLRLGQVAQKLGHVVDTKRTLEEVVTAFRTNPVGLETCATTALEKLAELCEQEGDTEHAAIWQSQAKQIRPVVARLSVASTETLTPRGATNAVSPVKKSPRFPPASLFTGSPPSQVLPSPRGTAASQQLSPSISSLLPHLSGQRRLSSEYSFDNSVASSDLSRVSLADMSSTSLGSPETSPCVPMAEQRTSDVELRRQFDEEVASAHSALEHNDPVHAASLYVALLKTIEGGLRVDELVHARIALNLSTIYLDAGRAREAVEVLQKLLDTLERGVSPPFDLLCTVLIRMGEAGTAAGMLEPAATHLKKV